MSSSALVYLSFGGPEKVEDVVPFLENVTRGRGIPRERLEQVGEHYFTLGGRSPINDQNREIIANLEAELRERGMDLPIYFGNRNWHPYVEDAMVQAVRDGAEHLHVFATSAWGGYSGCAQYQEDIRRGLATIAEAGLPTPTVERLPQFHAQPAFISLFARAVDAARDSLDNGSDAELIFTAHSVPNVADDASGPPEFGGNLYSQQVLDAARMVQQASSFAQPESSAGDPAVKLTWQSRSGSPHVPWLEPDICDYIEARAEAGNRRGIVLCPVGFITDHIEVMWDLDTEAKQVAEEAGVPFVRVDTPGLTREFAAMIVDLINNREAPRHLESQRAAKELVESIGRIPDFGHTREGAYCAPGCCGSSTPE